jgi:hypothetical protein
MSWDSVPWFVGGGAEHSPEVARLLAFAAIGGAEGVVGVGDLKVVPFDVPGGGVLVSAGAGLILNRATGGDSQTYVARNPTADTAQIAQTGSSSGRSDLIVAQIEDPNMAGEPWSTPADPKVGPYIFTRVIPNVPAGTKRLQDVPGYGGRSAITLARVDLPASTGTVTAAMITDLRTVARPRQTRVIDAVTPSVTGRAFLQTTADTLWPDRAVTVDVPTWATKIVATGVLSGALQFYGSADLTAKLRLGSGSGAVTAPDLNVVLEADASDKQRTSLSYVLTATIPAAMRGTTQPIGLYARRNGSVAGRFGLDGASRLVIDATFSEAAV